MSNFSIVILISGSGTNLQAIIDQVKSGYIHANIACVFSNNPNALGLERAAKHSIKHIAIDHTLYKTREDYDADLIQAIKPFKPDLIVLAGFMRILTSQFFQTFTHKIINIHPSLLPRHRGMNTHQRALDAGDKQHGISVHIATEQLDSGPVIAQANFPINNNDSAQDLQKQCHQLEHVLYPLIIKWLIQSKIIIETGEVYFKGLKLSSPILLNQIDAHELPKTIL